jgi:uroporphyrinogen-III synthase
MKVGEGITGWVAEHGESVVITESSYTDSRFKFFSNLPEDKYEAFMSVPIIYKNKVGGVINIQHRKAYRHSEGEFNLLQTIGRLVGGAVENALLIEQSLALKEALELRKLLDRAKGILMKRKKISEEDAFKLIQKQSMDKRKSVKEIVEAILLSDEMDLVG